MVDAEMIEAMSDEDIQEWISELSKTIVERKKTRYELALNLFEKALRELVEQYPTEIAIEIYDDRYDNYSWRELLCIYNQTKHTIS